MKFLLVATTVLTFASAQWSDSDVMVPPITIYEDEVPEIPAEKIQPIDVAEQTEKDEIIVQE